jgi:hypothetical protein
MNSSMFGIPELMILLVIAGYWALPLAAAIWVIVTLKRIRASQQSLQLKLDTIERLLQRS